MKLVVSKLMTRTVEGLLKPPIETVAAVVLPIVIASPMNEAAERLAVKLLAPLTLWPPELIEQLTETEISFAMSQIVMSTHQAATTQTLTEAVLALM